MDNKLVSQNETLVLPLSEFPDINTLTFVDQKDATAITHSGIFHADEVFATATLFFIGRATKVARVGNLPDGYEKNRNELSLIIYDIGNGDYDHHRYKKYRNPDDPNSIYSSFGLIWKEYGREVINKMLTPSSKLTIDKEKVFKIIDDTIVQSIDRIDNGIIDDTSVFSVSKLISNYNASWNEDNSLEIQNENFKAAVSLAYVTLYNDIKRVINSVSSIPIMIEALKSSTINDGQILLLDKFCPYESFIQETSNDLESEYYCDAKKIKFVIFPSNRGGYMVMTISDGNGGFRHNITMTLMPDQKFRHANGYCAGTNTIQSAIRLCEKSLEEA